MNEQLPTKASPAGPTWPVSNGKTARNESEEVVVEDLIDLFSRGRPLPALAVYAYFEETRGPCKTVICPVAPRMGIKKVKRKSGWWWVAPWDLMRRSYRANRRSQTTSRPVHLSLVTVGFVFIGSH